MQVIRLNLGSGESVIEGFTPVDICGDKILEGPQKGKGMDARHLEYPDNSVDEIYVSHLLEHFSHKEVEAILKEWVRVLKPGGRMRIAVPDFKLIAEKYLKKEQGLPYLAIIMGSHTDEFDVHKNIFDEDSLSMMMAQAGLENIEHFKPFAKDCSEWSISLNLQGTKKKEPIQEQVPIPKVQILAQNEKPIENNLTLKNTFTQEKSLKIGALMNIPRLGWNETWGCVVDAMRPLGIPIMRTTGAFWGPCMQRGFQKAVDTNLDILLTIDYDSIFKTWHVRKLLELFADHPEIDALCANQPRREGPEPLFTVLGEDGKRLDKLPRTALEQEVMPINTGHFGLTIIDVKKLEGLPKPWFFGDPGKNGDWGEDRIDDDIYFWLNWKANKRTIYNANAVNIGHLQLYAAWYDKDIELVHQYVNHWLHNGVPAQVLKGTPYSYEEVNKGGLG